VALSSFNLKAQNIELPKPDSLSINNSMVESEYGIDLVVYIYLIENFNSKTEKFDLEYFDWDKEKICGFKQEFEDGIKYTNWKCKEAGGISVNIEFPKMKREDLMEWVEQINGLIEWKTSGNVWKENNSKFEPKVVEPGCYYEIKESINKTIVEIYCGC